MWGSLPANSQNTAPLNDNIYESDLPTFTTDVRMSKVSDFFNFSPDHGTIEGTIASGGGGPVEAVWWVREAMTQWRIRGFAFVVGPDIDEESVGARKVKSEIGERMRVLKPGKENDWSWTRELTAHFGNLSPVMRGMSCVSQIIMHRGDDVRS
jgi:hypothetical protein